ncbi:hypothetical protein SADUNF_Sadunf10G0106800 [Salix dunnii]|uniref:Uncharacterized protein n=1 Tax=Salix dunnii TaxID=1413687 RepID=A0A835MRV2_9ROSI|nr:hypothetical protein SADUNF_Sadunf10G0106800 [Salix dunnii]
MVLWLAIHLDSPSLKNQAALNLKTVVSLGGHQGAGVLPATVIDSLSSYLPLMSSHVFVPNLDITFSEGAMIINDSKRVSATKTHRGMVLHVFYTYGDDDCAPHNFDLARAHMRTVASMS